jgi:cell division protein FtsB
MIKISKELRNEMGKVVEKSDQLKRDIRTLDDFDYLKEKY